MTTTSYQKLKEFINENEIFKIPSLSSMCGNFKS